jgi:uncharacterized UPF0160 family protein
MKKIVVHNGHFHPDDVFAVAILKILYRDIEVIRSRDEKDFKKADIRIDVGRRYNVETMDFDHHQPEGAGVRPNDIPYASAGLIWNHFGLKIVEDKFVLKYLDDKLFSYIDAMDNGYEVFESVKLYPYTINEVIESFYPEGKSADKEIDNSFFKAVDFAVQIIKKEIQKGKDILLAREIVKKSINPKEADLIILDEYVKWKEAVLSLDTSAKIIIYPALDGDWSVQVIPVKLNSFSSRIDFPVSWAGLEGEEFEKQTGIKGAKFCHRNLFIVRAKDKDSAIKLAKIALANNL